jgi:hypothetical protein
MSPLCRPILWITFSAFLSGNAALQDPGDSPTFTPLRFSFPSIDHLMGSSDEDKSHAALLERTKNGLKEIVAATQQLQAALEENPARIMSAVDLSLHIAQLTESWEAPPATKEEADLLSMVIRGTLDSTLQEYLNLKHTWDRAQLTPDLSDSSEASEEGENE